jgi:hypothetical protein
MAVERSYIDAPYLDFSGRDYTATFERLISILRSEVPELTDLNHSDAGISLIRLVARDSDQLAFYLDHAFAEGYIISARYKQSLLDLAHLTGYYPPLSAAASVTLTATRDEGVGAITIPKYSQFRTAGGIRFTTLEEYTMPNGINTLPIEAFQGDPVSVDLLTGDFEFTDESSYLKTNLGVRVADGTVEVTNRVATEVSWTQVESFWRSRSTDYHFMLETYADEYEGQVDTTFLTVGDGTWGQNLPSEGLTVKFIRTDEATGNVGYGLINEVMGDIHGDITVTNAAPATGGAPVWDVERLRSWLPIITQTQRRAVTLPDYVALVGSVAGVRQVQALDRNDSPVWPHMYVALYVVPNGGGPMSGGLKSSIWALLADRGHLGAWETRYLLFDPEETSVTVTCNIKVLTGYQGSTVATNVITAIQAFFEPDVQGIGVDLDYTALNRIVDRVAGVDYAQFITPLTTISGTDGHIFVAGTVTVNVV